VDTRVETLSYKGLDCWRLSAGAASAVVARHGAQVLSWIDRSGVERLFLSERALLEGSSAIRGGIPVCFPQFSGLGSLPKHGLVRTRAWDLASINAEGAAAVLELGIADDAHARALWPHAWEARLRVVLGAASLEVELTVRNRGDTPFAFTGALHTYLAVEGIGGAAVSGLQGVEYRDAANGGAVRVEEADPVVIGTEVDRVYHDVPTGLLLRCGARGLAVEAAGFPDVVLWNPWAVLCAGLPDMAPEGYLRMLCIEAAAARVPVVVVPGAQWAGRQVLRPV
jgi:glucose-6-phosphate 1-epimerase